MEEVIETMNEAVEAGKFLVHLISNSTSLLRGQPTILSLKCSPIHVEVASQVIN